MTITKKAMEKLFADLNPADAGAVAAALADFARINRPNSGHRLPVALAARLRDFAVECGVDESAVAVADPSYGYSAVRFTAEAMPFLERLCALGLATDKVQAELAVHGPSKLISCCADTPVETGDPVEAGTPVPEPLVPAVAAALSNAAVKFLEQIGPLADLPDHACTPANLESWAEDNDDLAETPDFPDNLDVGDFNACVREMRFHRNHPGIPSLPSIETALIYLDMAPELPNSMTRVFYGLAFNNAQPALGRYVADGETMPDFRLLLSDIPGEQCNIPGRGDNPLAGYLANDIGRLETLRSRGAVAFLCFGSAFLTRKDTEVLAFASDTKAFWDYVRELYARWIALGDPDIGAALREGKLKLAFHPFSRVGLRDRSNRAEYADMSEEYAVDHSMIGFVAGDNDSDLRSGEFDYTDSDDEDDADRENRFDNESSLFRRSCAAAIYGFAVVPGASEVADGVKAHDTVFHVVREQPVAVHVSEDDEGAEDRLGVDDLPLEWSALIHGLDIRTVQALHDFFADKWAELVCWPSDTNTGFPVRLPVRSTDGLGQPNMAGFLGETLRAFRALSNNDCTPVPEDDQSYTVPAAHNSSWYVTAVYTGMTVSGSPAFDIGETPKTFSVPISLVQDICQDQSRGLHTSALPETVTEWLEHLSVHPEVQLKCAKRKSGDTTPRTAWVVVETNVPFDKVQRQCNDLYLGDTTHVARDILRSLFTDAVIRGQDTLFNRFFQFAPGSLPSDDARLGSAVVNAAGCCPDKDAATRVVIPQIPLLFASDGVSTSWTFTPNELRKYVKVSLAADKYNRLVVVVAVDGVAANVARLRYRVPGAGVTRFGVFTASMMRAYRAVLDNPVLPGDVFIAPGTDWETARPLMFRAVSHAARYGNVTTMDPPYGGLTTLMLAPRGEYDTDEPYRRTDYTPCTGVRADNGVVRALLGFEPELPF